MPEFTSRPALSPRGANLLTAFVLVAVARLYAPRLGDFFLSDDFHYLRACAESSSFGANDEWYGVTVGELNFHFRPVFGVTGWLIYAVFGMQSFWWHLASLSLHLLATWLTIILVRRFVGGYWTAALAGAILCSPGLP